MNLLKLSIAIFLLSLLSCCSKYNGSITPIKLFTTKLESEIGEYQINTDEERSFGEKITYKSFNIGTNISSKPIISYFENKKVMYVLNDRGVLSCLDVDQNFKNIWKVDTLGFKTKAYSGGNIEISENTVYVTNGTRDLIALDQVNGYEKSRIRLSNVIKSKPVVYKNIIFLVTVDDKLCAIDRNNLRILWEKDNIDEPISVSSSGILLIHENKLIVGYSSGILSCYNPENGDLLWSHFLNDVSSIPEMTVLNANSEALVYKLNGRDHLYVSFGFENLYAIDISSSIISMKRKAYDIHFISNHGNAFFLSNNASQIAALSPELKVIFSIDLEEKSKSTDSVITFVSSFASNNSVFFLTDSKKMYKVDCVSKKLDSITELSINPKWIVEDGENVYIASENKILLLNK